MRVAALALGVLAGLIASLILALGGLDVAVADGANAERQAQAIRFGIFIIGNLGVFGAALVLASPLAGAIFLVLGALAWVAAALLTRQAADLVLITPPALMLLATVFAVIAHFRRPAAAVVVEEEPEVDVLDPEPAERANRRPSEMMEAEEEVGMPAFAAEPQARAAAPAALPRDDDWNPRKRPPPPPRAKPAFRPIEEEYDEEPSGFSRFAMGISGFLSFGLYAALAGAAVLIFWSARNAGDQPAAVVAEAPAVSSSAEPSSSEQPRLASADETLTPILTGEPIRDVLGEGTAPSASPSELVAETATSEEPATFEAVTTPDGPGSIPTLSDDFANADSSLTPVSADPPSLPPEETSSEPPPVELEPPSAEVVAVEPPPQEPVAPTAIPDGMAWPRAVPPPIAAQRLAPGTGPTIVATPPASTNNNNTGL